MHTYRFPASLPASPKPLQPHRSRPYHISQPLIRIADPPSRASTRYKYRHTLSTPINLKGNTPPPHHPTLKFTSAVRRHPRIHGNIRNSNVSLGTT